MAFLGATVFFFSYSALLFAFNFRPIRVAIHHLKRLGRDEKSLHRQLFLEDRRTAYINVFNFNVVSASLVAKGILTWSSSIIVPLQAGVVIQPYVMEFLKKNPEYIDLTRADLGREPYRDSSPWHRRPDLEPPCFVAFWERRTFPTTRTSTRIALGEHPNARAKSATSTELNVMW